MSFKDKSQKITHEGHATDELAFQLLIRDETYQNIPVKKLKQTAKRIAGMIRNYQFQLARSEGAITPISDEDAHDPDFWFESAIKHLEGPKKKM